MRRVRSGTYAKMPLNYEGLRAFIVTIGNPEHRLMVALIVAAGLRVGEVSKMLKSDVSGPSILVRKTKCRMDKKGKPIRPYREVPTPAWVQEIIDDSLPIIRRLERYPKPGPEDFLFQKERGGGQIKVGGINDRLNTIFRNFEKKEKVTCHSLRRTASVHLYSDCGDLSIVQLFLDHSSIATTGVYVQKGRAVFNEAYLKAFA